MNKYIIFPLLCLSCTYKYSEWNLITSVKWVEYADVHYPPRLFGGNAKPYIFWCYSEDFGACSRFLQNIEIVQDILSETGCYTSGQIDLIYFGLRVYITDQSWLVDPKLGKIKSKVMFPSEIMVLDKNMDGLLHESVHVLQWRATHDLDAANYDLKEMENLEWQYLHDPGKM